MTPDRWADLAAALAVGALVYAGTWAAIRLALWAWEHMGRPAPRPDPDDAHGASCVAVSRHYLQHVHPDPVPLAGIRGWAITGQDPRAVHVVPIGDPFPHTWDDCPCQPATYHDPDDWPHVVHNAEDDRP